MNQLTAGQQRLVTALIRLSAYGLPFAICAALHFLPWWVSAPFAVLAGLQCVGCWMQIMEDVKKEKEAA